MLSSYPTSSFLIRGGAAPRLRVLDDQGRPDHAAIRMASRLLTHLDVGDSIRAAARTALDRYAPLFAEKYVAKDAVGFGDLADEGLVREVGGLTVFIEHPNGSTRTGTSPDGSTWSTPMLADYGFLPMTLSVDGEELDAYVGPNLLSTLAFVISQVREDGSYDEPKLMLGFDSETDAIRCYMAHVPAWCFGGVTALPLSLIVGLMNIEIDAVMKTVKAFAASPSKPVEKANVDVAAITSGGKVVSAQAGTLDEKAIEKATDGTKAIPMTVEMVGYFTDPKQNAPTFEPTDNRCAICGVPWTEKDVRTFSHSLTESEGPSNWTIFYRTHGSCADASPDGIVSLDAQALRIINEKVATGGHGDTRKTWRVAASWRTNTKTALASHVFKVAKTANAFAIVKGWDSSTSHAGQVIPLDEAPTDAARAVASSPLTETYENPESNGGWLGVIEPESGEWIAFVGVDGRTLLWTQREPDGGVIGVPFYTYRLDLATVPISDAISKGWKPIMKFRVQVLGQRAEDTAVFVQKGLLGEVAPSAKPKRRIVYGVVLEPHPCDGQGDSQGHTYDEEFVRDACHYYSQFRLLNSDHQGAPIDPAHARVVEIYLAPVDFTLETPRGPQPVKRGSWVMGTEVLSDALWAKVEAGDWQAYSVEGFSRSTPLENTHWQTRQMNCTRCSATWRASFAKDRAFPPSIECPRCHAQTPTAIS